MNGIRRKSQTFGHISLRLARAGECESAFSVFEHNCKGFSRAGIGIFDDACNVAACGNAACGIAVGES